MDGKMSDIQQITPASRAEWLFTGSAAADYSADDSQDVESPIQRPKHHYSEVETIEVALLWLVEHLEGGQQRAEMLRDDIENEAA